MWRRLEQTFGRFAVPNITAVLIAVQVVVYVASIVQGRELLVSLALDPSAVLEGEIWRLITFLALPPPFGKDIFGVIFTLIFWHVFYFMGTALERNWGVFRYNVYLLVWFVVTVATSFLTPGSAMPNYFLETSVFLAFAYLFPNIEFRLFLIIPVKVKWLGILTWILLGLGLVGLLGTRQWFQAIQLVGGVTNFFLFFGGELFERMLWGRRRLARRAARARQQKKEPNWHHRCRVCGKTDVDDPHEEFRYCSRCIGQQAYCAEHLHNHEHIVENDPVA